MYDKLAARILKSLPKRPRDEEPLPVEKKLEGELRAVKSLDGLLDALLTLECVVSAKAALELLRYQWTVPFKNQQDRVPAIRQQADIVYQAYRTASTQLGKVLADPGGAPLAQDVKAALERVIPRITISGEYDHKGVADFLATVKDFLVLSLWVSSRGNAGRQLLSNLAAEPQAKVTIGIRYKRGPSSLLAYVPPNTVTAHGKPQSVPQMNPFLDLFDKSKPLDKGAGSPTDLGAPVWLPASSGTDALEAAPVLFTDYLTVEAALKRILLGGASFGRGRQVFYTPVRIELMHELIHVLHNARGANREIVSLPAEDKNVWTNAEEFWAIAGGKINENLFNAEVGLPQRHGHSGIALASLDPGSDTAAESFASISGVP
jgi:hypothetical protein